MLSYSVCFCWQKWMIFNVLHPVYRALSKITFQLSVMYCMYNIQWIVSMPSAQSSLFPHCNLCGEKMMPLTAIACNSAIVHFFFFTSSFSLSHLSLVIWSDSAVGCTVFSKGIWIDTGSGILTSTEQGLWALRPFFSLGHFVNLLPRQMAMHDV